MPLWYAHYDNSASFTDYDSFGGWSSPTIKQYEGDKSSCGVGIDYDYISSFSDLEKYLQDETASTEEKEETVISQPDEEDLSSEEQEENDIDQPEDEEVS